MKIKSNSRRNKDDTESPDKFIDKLESSIYQQLFEIGKHLLAESTVDKLLSVALDKTIEISKAERGMIILFGEEEENLFQAARNLKQEDIEHPKFEISRTIIDNVKQEKQPIYLHNALEDSSYKKSSSVKRLKILSVICLPLVFEEKVFGVTYLDNRTVKGIFKQDTFELVFELTNFISLAAFQALHCSQLSNRVSELEKELRGKYKFENIIGHHSKMVAVLKLVSQIADSNATVLIQGESGTGKELIARALHFNSSRLDKPFIPVNCGALPENLLESELFGHVRGAFTGAVNDRVGWFEKADSGTIFLDEISEMSPALQVKLLRILQTGEYSKVGSTELRYCDVRVLAATNKNLQQYVKDGKFREDVYYRLNVVEIELPALRQRRSDIPLLVKYFLDFYNKKSNRNIKLLSPEAEAILLAYNFPGNVRELENIMLHAVTLTENEIIEPPHLPARVRGKEKNFGEEVKPSNLQEAKRRASDKAENEFIKECLEATSGHISKAAKLAGMDVGNFHRIITKHEIDASVFKKSRF